MQISSIADDFKPIINPKSSLALTISSTTTTVRPTALNANNQQKSLSPDNIAADAQDKPVAEAWIFDPPSRFRRRIRRPVKPLKRYQSVSTFNRSRRRPKPHYGPPTYEYEPAPNDYHQTDLYDPYVPKSRKKESNSQNEYSVVDTDIGKFYDASSATFHVRPIKTQYEGTQSSYYTSSGSGSGGGGETVADTDDYTSYKYSGASSSGGGSDDTAAAYRYNAPAEDGGPYKIINTFTSPGADEYKYTDTGGSSSNTNAGGPYPPSTSNFDASKFNLYETEGHTVYQTNPYAKKIERIPAADVLTKPLVASYSFASGGGTSGSSSSSMNNYKTSATAASFQRPQKPPSTSYGVPIGPTLNTYTYHSELQNSPNYKEAKTSFASQNNFVQSPSYSLTRSQENTGGISEGHFAEPPKLLNEQELAIINENLYRKPQSSYDASSYYSAIPTEPPRRPIKVHSKRVTTPNPNPIEEEVEYEDPSESYVVHKPMPQPNLPNSYDQEEFHTVTKNKRKPTRPQKSGQSFSSYYERGPAKRSKATTTTTTTTTTRSPYEDYTEAHFEIPDDDYVDDLFRTQAQTTTKRPTPRPKKPTKPTTQHVLDTDDLRDAFESSNRLQNAKSKSKVNRNRAYQQAPQRQHNYYDEDEFDDDEAIIDIDSNERMTVMRKIPKTRQKPNSSGSSIAKQIERGTLTPPALGTKSSYKQSGIQSRNDNFSYTGGIAYSGFRPFMKPAKREEDRSDLFDPNESRNKYDIGIAKDVQSGERISTTLRTTTKSSTPYVWDGKILPKNHKMA